MQSNESCVENVEYYPIDSFKKTQIACGMCECRITQEDDILIGQTTEMTNNNECMANYLYANVTGTNEAQYIICMFGMITYWTLEARYNIL
jgi:hypothetical protein